MGYNSNGQLGIGNTTDQHAPVVVTNNVVAMAAGSVHSLFVTANGTLWAMGNNSNGQLGDGTTTQRNSPVSVTTNVVAVAAGYSHSLYISAAGTLWAMGDNNDGQLGDGTTISRSNAVSIAGNVIAVAAGYYHSLYISVDGTLWAMGNNGNGQLGDGTTTQRKSPVSVPGMSLATVVSGLNANHTLAIGMSLPPNDNRISCQLLSAGDMRLSFAGVPGWNYALDRSFSLLPTDWVPQATNSAGAGGVLVFTNTPDPTTNNFWRIRSVP